MTDGARQQNVIQFSADYEPEIARWVWAFEDTRRRTKQTLSGLQPAHVDWTPSLERANIGSQLYHIAAIEVDYLHADILQANFTPEVEALFSHNVRDAEGRLTLLTNLPLADHVRRLDTVRAIFLSSLRGMSIAEFRRARRMSDYDVTPEWVIHHLMQHEAEHRAGIAALRADAERKRAL
ncbi:MAG TPA: DinB family protein [Anaerolineales bacterium]|nr:DinB family protein [Anaerolineales bacterium]HLF03016.1 DinB family protein [Anaerolineales bacterium]